MTNLSRKSILFICCAIVTFGLLPSCDVYESENCPSYVVCYVHLDSIALKVESSVPQCISVETLNDYSKTYSLHCTGAEKMRYDQLCQKHQDVSYNRKRMFNNGVLDIEHVTYDDCDFKQIAITADKSFDESHPAGSDLSDMVRFMSWSPYKYILNGYSQYYHYSATDVSETFDRVMRIYGSDKCFAYSTDATCYPIDKLIKDLAADDLVLLGHDNNISLGMLYFERAPAESGEYTITVSLTTDEDRVISESIAMQF